MMVAAHVLTVIVMLVLDGDGRRMRIHSRREIDEGKSQGSQRKIFFQSSIGL